jgi:two-component system CheB/CheR fusion protein
MPQKLIEFIRHVRANGARISAFAEKSREPLQQVFSILRTKTGHDFSRYKANTVHRRLERRMSVNGIDDLSQYANFLRQNEAEAGALLKDLLISVTNFFRDPEAYESLKEKLCELIEKRDRDSELRAWVAGCATGEESYSIAMAIFECMDEKGKRLQVQTYGTDIDTDALKVARAGVYPANIAADLTPARLKRFFLKQENSYQVKKELREMVVFAPQDFIKDPPFSRMDLICCRNLLIYLETDIQKKLLPLLHYALKPGGLLFLGPSETIGDASDLFSTVDKKWKIFQRKEVAVSPERLRFPSAFALSQPVPTVEAVIDQAARVPALAEKVFLDSYAPTFAVIDEKHRVIYVRGRTGKYLEIASGQPNLSIVELAREGLRSELASAVYEAVTKKKAVSRKGVRVKYNGGYQSIILTVAPLTNGGIPPGLMIVVFQESGPTAEESETRPTKERRRGTALIEEELKLTRGNLQRTIEELEASNEELKSANEELQSNNEELQSANEELDTSREELQSLNEEMMTVNAELTSKTETLTKANDDLKNYLNRTDIAIIFLDQNLNIRSYTPATADVYNIRSIDVGRPLAEITSRLANENVVNDARKVLRSLIPKEMEVQRKDGRWYNMRILPYLTVQNSLDGLVISFLDINIQKQAEGGLRRLATIVEDSNDSIISYDLEGKILTWNRGAERMYGYSEAEALKMNNILLVP